MTEVDAPTARPDGRRLRWPGADTWFVVGCWAVLVLPLAVAALAARQPTWFPVADLAQYELRVRDVGSIDTPLVGLAGRIGPWYDPGSHPGPLSFWLLAPVYRLLGSTSFAFVASAVTLHATAIGLTLWMAKRRGGLAVVLGFTVVLAALTRFYGPQVFIEPWNPYLPVMWWVVLLVAVWSVLDGDVPMVLVAVVAGTFCAQTHLPYVGLVGGLAVFLVVPLATSIWRARRSEERAEFLRLRNWTIAGAVLGVALWIPPVIDEIWGVGNLTRIRDSLSSPTEGVSGPKRGVGELLRNLDPTALWTGRDLTGVSNASGVCWPAVLLLAVWAASAVGAWRCGHRTLLRLHAVLGGALVLAMISSTRIYGLLWSYLFLWAWGLLALILVAAGWSLVVLARRTWPNLAASDRIVPVSFAGLALVAVLLSGSFAIDNRDAEPSRTDLSQDLGAVSAQAVPTLRSGEVIGGEEDGRYLVRWTDRVTIGSQGFGLVNELERQGFTVGVDEPFGVGATKHRIMSTDEATAIVQLVTGPDIAAWDADPAATRIAYTDGRTEAERAEYEAMVDDVQAQLEAKGLDRQASEWRGNLFTTSLDEDVPEEIREDMREVLAIRVPVAIYVTAPDAS